MAIFTVRLRSRDNTFGGGKLTRSPLLKTASDPAGCAFATDPAKNGRLASGTSFYPR